MSNMHRRDGFRPRLAGMDKISVVFCGGPRIRLEVYHLHLWKKIDNVYIFDSNSRLIFVGGIEQNTQNFIEYQDFLGIFRSRNWENQLLMAENFAHNSSLIFLFSNTLCIQSVTVSVFELTVE
jgi:hypothetical protein